MKQLNNPRWQEIKHNLKSSYVIYKGKRLRLDMFTRQEIKSMPNIQGVYGTSYFSAYAIEISSCGEMAKLYSLIW